MDVKLSDGYFDLCINASKDNTSNLRSILLRLYQSKFPNYSIYHYLSYWLKFKIFGLNVKMFITSIII